MRPLEFLTHFSRHTGTSATGNNSGSRLAGARWRTLAPATGRGEELFRHCGHAKPLGSVTYEAYGASR